MKELKEPAPNPPNLAPLIDSRVNSAVALGASFGLINAFMLLALWFSPQLLASVSLATDPVLMFCALFRAVLFASSLLLQVHWVVFATFPGTEWILHAYSVGSFCLYGVAWGIIAEIKPEMSGAYAIAVFVRYVATLLVISTIAVVYFLGWKGS